MYVPNAYIQLDKIYVFTYMVAIWNISNCSRAATCHPPGIVHWDPIDE